jgi:hypothetical protein
MSVAPKCPRCWLRSDLVPGTGLCWPCNTFAMDREDDAGETRDWRIGRRVAVKYRTDPRFGTHGAVALASGDRVTIRTDAGELMDDHADNWRTA